MLEMEPGAGPDNAGSKPRTAASPAPGKSSRTQDLSRGHGPVATAARLPDEGGGGPATSVSSSQSIQFSEGQVPISETVTATVSHGEGPISFNLSKEGLSVGNEHMGVDLKSANAVTGKGLKVTGASVEISKIRSSHSKAKLEDGYVGVEYETEWEVKGRHGWSASFSISAFVGVKPPKPHHHWWDDIPVISSVAAAVAAVVAIGGAIIASAPEWGPVVAVALA